MQFFLQRACRHVTARHLLAAATGDNLLASQFRIGETPWPDRGQKARRNHDLNAALTARR